MPVFGSPSLVVPLGRYRIVTLDEASDSDEVLAALATAQAVVEEYLRRPLLRTSRTETLRLDKNGRVYPAATPITVAPEGLTILDGSAIANPTPDAGPIWRGTGLTDYPVEATITYTGGFTAATLPKTIERHIAWLAYEQLHVGALVGVPAGATSVSLGDARVSFDRPTGASVSLSAVAKRELRPWRRRWV